MKLIAWPRPLGRLAFLGHFLLATLAAALIFLVLHQIYPWTLELANLGGSLLYFDSLVARARDIGYQGRFIYLPFGLVVLGTLVQSVPSPLQSYGSDFSAIVILFALFMRTGSMKEKPEAL